jgi:hypothetical protein
MMNWLRKLVGLGGTAKNLTSLNEEDCKEEVKSFAEKTHLDLFQGNVQNLYSTQRIKETSICPRCESKTEKKAAIFVCATNTLPQIIISTANHFCTNCSSAIIDDKLLQNNCEKGKVYRGIIGFYIKENIQTYQSLNEYIIRYHYDQNSNPSGIKITGDKIATYDPKIHGSKGTKSHHKIPSSPVTLMDRVERRDKKESLTDSKFSNRKDRSNQDDDSESMTEEQKDKAARSERARIAMENVGKKVHSKPKPKSKEDFADSVNETKQDFKDKVEQKSSFNPKKKQKPVVENPNDKTATKQDKKQEKQVEVKQIEPKQTEVKQEETKNLSASQAQQAPPARASQRKKQTSPSDKKEEENVTTKQTDKKQNVVEAKQDSNQDSKVEANQTTESKTVDATSDNQENAAPKKNRRYKQRRSTRKTRNSKRPERNTVETEQEIPTNEVKIEPKNEPKVELKNEQMNEQNSEQKSEQKNQQTRKQQPRRQNAQKQKEVAPEVENKAQNAQTQSKADTKETDKADNKDTKPNQNQDKPKKESVIEKLHQNLQESSKASIAPKEEKPKEQPKESSRLARLKQEDTEEKTSRRRPRTNVRPPIELDLKNVNPRRRYNNTKKK